MVSRIVLLTIPVSILLFTINKRIVPFGKLSETYKFEKQGVIISDISTASGVSDRKKSAETGKYYLEINDSPAYFNVNLPFDANYIDLDVTFEKSGPPIIQFGIPYKHEKEPQYIINTIQNDFIDDLGVNTLISGEGDVMLLRNPNSSIDHDKSFTNSANDLSDYLNEIPSEKTVATYQVNINDYFRLKDYTPNFAKKTIDTILRGSHDIVTYIEDETLDYTFYFSKRSPSKKNDEVNVKLYHDGILVSEFEDYMSVSIDDGEFDKKISVIRSNLPVGLYTLKVTVGSNTNIKRISTKQKYMAFKDRLFLDNKEISSRYYVNSNMVFKTSHSSGLQTVTVDGERVEIEKLNKYYGSTIDREIARVVVPKSDILIEYDGIASTEVENIRNFGTEFGIVDLEDSACNSDLDFDYVLSSYYEPQTSTSGAGNYTATLKVSDLFVENNSIKLKFIVPCLKEYQNVRLNEIKVTLRK